MQKPFSSEKKNIYISFIFFWKKDRCHVFCERFKTCFLNENHPEQFALRLHEAFWVLRITCSNLESHFSGIRNDNSVASMFAKKWDSKGFEVGFLFPFEDVYCMGLLNLDLFKTLTACYFANMEAKDLSFPTSLRFFLPPSGSIPTLCFISVHGVHLHHVHISDTSSLWISSWVNFYRRFPMKPHLAFTHEQVRFLISLLINRKTKNWTFFCDPKYTNAPVSFM
jgi:hypothetical protein